LGNALAIRVGGAAPELAAGVPAGFGGAERRGLATLRTGGNAVRRFRRRGLLLLSLALGKAGGRELFAVATLFNKGSFQGGNLLVEQIIGLVDEANGRVCPNGRVSVFKPALVKRPTLCIRQIGQIRQIRQMSRIFSELSGYLADHESLRRVRLPKRQPAMPEEILIIQQQLFQAGAGDIEQAELSLR
jgi:hypothetical protein